MKVSLSRRAINCFRGARGALAFALAAGCGVGIAVPAHVGGQVQSPMFPRSAMGSQAGDRALGAAINPVFRPLLARLAGEVTIPVLLPAYIPRQGGTTLYATLDDLAPRSYLINVDLAPNCHGATACHLATVTGGSPHDAPIVPGDPHARQVRLANGAPATYYPYRCGASCGDGTLAVRAQGFTYTVGLKAGALNDLLAMANSLAPVAASSTSTASPDGVAPAVCTVPIPFTDNLQPADGPFYGGTRVRGGGYTLTLAAYPGPTTDLPAAARRARVALDQFTFSGPRLPAYQGLAYAVGAGASRHICGSGRAVANAQSAPVYAAFTLDVTQTAATTTVTLRLGGTHYTISGRTEHWGSDAGAGSGSRSGSGRAASLVALSGAAATGGPPIAAGAAAPLTGVDWPDATYTSACFSARPRPFAARGGVARDGAVRFQVYAPIFADLTGDGRPEALVPYSCTGADFGGVHVFVYTGDAVRPRLLGEIPAPGGPPTGGLASVQSVTAPALVTTPEQRTLTVEGVGYSATATHTCPDLRVVVSYRVVVGGLIAVGSTATRASGCLSL